MKTVKGAAMAKERRFSTIDINLSSFLELNGLHASLELIKGKVVFVFP